MKSRRRRCAAPLGRRQRRASLREARPAHAGPRRAGRCRLSGAPRPAHTVLRGSLRSRERTSSTKIAVPLTAVANGESRPLPGTQTCTSRAMTARCGRLSKLVMRVPFPSPALVVAAQVTAPISCRQRSSESGVPVVCPSGRVTTLLPFQPRQGHEALGEERAEDGRIIVTAGARK